MSRPSILPPLCCLLFCCSLFSGCVYERINILVGADIYDGRILTHYNDVEKTTRGILLKPGARLAIRTPFVTQVLAQMDVAILEGSGMTAYLRTVPHGFDATRGVAFRYAVDGCQIRLPGGRQIPLHYNADTAQQTLSFYHEAALLTVAAGCQRLYEGESELPATEYLILESLPDSRVEIRSIKFHETNIK